nr:cadherin-related family member 5-like isoform X2 [Geotrypetes seraphini]
MTSSVRLCLSGPDANWLFLEAKTVRLNVPSGKKLDREALEPPVLLATLSCSEEGFATIQYRIVVQVLNENDNKPVFLEKSVMAQNISELTAVDSLILSAQAKDKDGDILMFVINSGMADGRYFKTDVSTAGKVILAQSLDYETKQEMEFFIYAVEMNTKERYSSSARIHISIVDGDDQYPHFLPCNFLSYGETSVCVNPIYTANITEGQIQPEPLKLLPGPVYAEDGDKGLMTAVSYSILSGADRDHFLIDNVTGAITLVQAVESRVDTPAFSLHVMASQVNDKKKYSVTQVLIRVLAANTHPPRFRKHQHMGFVREDSSTAALVTTYSGRVLFLSASDADFTNGSNPKLQFSLKPQSNHTELFQVLHNGLLIARANQLHGKERYSLQVTVSDEDSGEMDTCAVNVEVLGRGQKEPPDPTEAQKVSGLADATILAGSLAAVVLFLGLVLCLIVCTVKSCCYHQHDVNQATLATEKQPSVINSSKSATSASGLYFHEYCNELAEDLNKCPAAVEKRELTGRTCKSTTVTHTAGKIGNTKESILQPAPIEVMSNKEDSNTRNILTSGKTSKRVENRSVYLGNEEPSNESQVQVEHRT